LETTKSLQVLLGTCYEEDKTVISQVFLGTLSGQLRSIIRVKTRIDPEAYGDATDIHSLLVLYSLAKDAQTRGQKPDVIINYLAEAYNIAANCKFDKLTTEDPVKQIVVELKTAIIKILVDELGAQRPSPSPCQSSK
jgi:hypothetical protein